MTRTKSTYLALLAALLSPMAANADMIIEYSEVGSDLVMEWSGSLNLSNVGNTDFNFNLSAIGHEVFGGAENPVFYSANSNFRFLGTFGGVVASGPSFWGAGLNYDENNVSATGDPFRFRYNVSLNSVNLWGPSYTAGTTISGMLTAHGYSIASSGVKAWSVDLLPNSNVGSIIIKAKKVPEPGTLALLALGLAGMGLTRRRRFLTK